jgi:hypothetical protein
MLSRIKYFFIGAIIAIIQPVFVMAQAPGWTNFQRRQAMYPTDQFIVGFSSERNVSEAAASQKLEELAEYARIQMTESVQVTIKSIGTLNVTNVNSQTHEFFKKTSTSFSKVSITGFKTETYYDRRSREAFAIAFANRSELAKQYEAAIDRNYTLISRKADLAASFAEKGDHQQAIKNYFECLLPFRELEEAFTLLVALSSQYFTIMEPRVKDIERYKVQVTKGIALYQQGDQLTISDLAYLMAKGYQVQLRPTKDPIRLEYFTYRDTDMVTPFSRRFEQAFEKHLVDAADLVITSPDKVNPHFQGINPFKDPTKAATGAEKYVIQGTFWEEEDKIRVISILRDTRTGKAIVSMEGLMRADRLRQQGIAIRPENYEVALEEVKIFVQEEPQQTDLVLDAWTNRGRENLLFLEGETMQVFVQVNKPSFLRFIYHLADGSRVLLLDNYFIGESQVNRPYQIPEEFVCAGPFGVETLQMNVQSDRFAPLQTVDDNGYLFIKDDLPEILMKTRGFKRKGKALSAEKRLVITTMPAD